MFSDSLVIWTPGFPSLPSSDLFIWRYLSVTSDSAKPWILTLGDSIWKFWTLNLLCSLITLWIGDSKLCFLALTHSLINLCWLEILCSVSWLCLILSLLIECCDSGPFDYDKGLRICVTCFESVCTWSGLSLPSPPPLTSLFSPIPIALFSSSQITLQTLVIPLYSSTHHPLFSCSMTYHFWPPLLEQFIFHTINLLTLQMFDCITWSCLHF